MATAEAPGPVRCRKCVVSDSKEPLNLAELEKLQCCIACDIILCAKHAATPHNDKNWKQCDGDYTATIARPMVGASGMVLTRLQRPCIRARYHHSLTH